MEKRPLIILTGPTAVGKTALSIGLAKAVGAEIISADSMQVYRQMDIGTAKIRPDQMQGVPHYLIDELDPSEEFNVMLFQQKCRQYMEEIYERGHIPILVGGTGFYIQSVLYDIDFGKQDTDGAYREELTHYAAEHGSEALHDLLKKVDPVTAKSVHHHNVKRVIRALEFYHETGQTLSSHNAEQHERTSPYNFRYYVLCLPRELLYERIEQRVDQMRQEGLVDEVSALKEQGCHRGMVSMQGLGYKEILDALDGQCSLEEAFDTIKKETRHFAKRQMTWFRREKEVCWVDKSRFGSEEELLDWCIQDLKEHHCIEEGGHSERDE